ncbi:MAG TPA: lytic transglycosylase domain-containing protein [Ferruginibacter sp.]|nr:lytic transglycosylase domain-containing protein [Chitinophagaceae bacterium]MBP6047269.1 lytic transglycosylase domain-containing protein [Ferruginibacter sp.]MBK7089917.1 lytic transglycosylase domain-containing protein [Chitinophagaceae bacterium]MBK7736060.1 lytic transglycosylase domain-containing protein [Chitinophagaceae bacterium]MBK8775490.1 lytic transglycosylase domain-containing protein [Chitinophagaceae bacterium]
MKQVSVYILLIALMPFGLVAQKSDSVLQSESVDSTIETDIAQNAIIDEIIEQKTVPQKDKVQYFSQLTRYGFKNLFNSFSYNPSLPYSSQVNPLAESYMQGYLRSHSKSLLKMKTWATPYFGFIDNVFSQYGLPRELKYLAVIESHLSTGATSWVGAAGPWQFMPYTAREYGLLVNGVYDERRDYLKSTHAAARYLLSLYKQTHDWLLVIAAYNGGPGRVFSAIKRSGSRNFWALQYYLPEESRNHVKKFIATHYIMEGNNPLSYNNAVAVINPYDNKPDISLKEAETAETQTITGKFNAVIIAKNLSMAITEFNRYNPGFDQLISANGQYELVLPIDKMQVFNANKYTILNECVQYLLSDFDVPNNKTVYPSKYNKYRKKGE